MPTFPNIDALETYVDTYIVANGIEAITGPINNDALNGCIEFIRQSPLNYAKAQIINSAGSVNVGGVPVNVFITNTPSFLTWTDNIYHEYIFINQTASPIQLSGSLVYYNLSGVAIDYIPANSSVNILKASNDLWVQANNTGGGGGTSQKQPKTYVVGSTVDAPTAGTSTWQLPAFAGSWVTLTLNRGPVPTDDPLDGGSYTSKTLGSDTLTINGYQWATGDILSYILITP